MNYDNIIYPLDKIYSDAVGTTYPVCGAGHDGPIPIDWKKEYFQIKNISEEVGLFSIGSNLTGNTEYSFDKVNWTSYDFTNRPTVEVNPNQTIYLRGTSWTNSYKEEYNKLEFNKSCNVSGNIMSLLNYNTMDTATSIPGYEGGFGYLFREVYVVSAENLNFGNVSSVNFAGLQKTFRESTLVIPPDFSTFTNIGSNGMNQCFYETNIVCSPNLKNITTISNYGIGNCFDNCSKLSTVYAPNVSSWNTTQFNQWLHNAGWDTTETKKVYAPTGITIPTNDSGIPSGWTRVDY